MVSAVMLLPLLSGCGGTSNGDGGGSGNVTLNGTWRSTAIGPANSSSASLVSCPGTVTVEGDEVSCGANDTITFTDNTFREDSPDDLGNPQRTTGTFSRSGSSLNATASQIATDENRDGVYEASETETLDSPISIGIQIKELTSNRLKLEFDLTNFGGHAFAATFSR